MSGRDRPWRDWLVVVACLVCQVGMGVGGYLFPVFLKPVGEDLGWSRTVYAAANPIMSTFVALAGPLVGWLSDRRGPRLVLVAGSLVMSAALLGASRMEQVWQFYLVAVGIGIGVACLGDLPAASAIAGRFADRRGLALGLVYVGSNVGGALGAATGAALAAEGGWRGALAAIGGTLWLLLLPFALVVGVPRPGRAASGQDGRASATHDPAPLGSFEPHDLAAADDAASALRQRDFWLLFWVLLAFYLYRLGVNTHLVAFLSDLGWAHGEAALGFSVTVGVGIVGKLFAGSIADRVGPRLAAVGNFVLIALASALLLVPDVPLAIPLFLLLHGAATAAEDVVVPLVVGRRFGTTHLGSIYGLLLLTLIPGGILGPVVAGAVFDASGSYGAVFVAFFVCNLTAVAALAAVRPARAA
ncbi:MAG: MFS transporter [Thermodesulfobacteriota bacterium]